MADDQTDTETLAPMTATSRNLLGRMSPAERAAGRYLRAPDGHDGDDPPADPPPATDPPPSDGPPADPPPADDPPADSADKSLMSKAGAKEDEPDPATLPPETYELTAPDGMTIDDALLAEVTPVFKELGLSNDAANKLMPLASTFAERLFTAQTDAHKAMTADWAKEAKADKDLGGANWGETESLVAKALDQFGAAEGSDFRKLLDDTGLGNHPEMIRMFRKIGERLGEGGDFVRPDAAAAIKQDRTAIMYPNDVPKEQTA